MNITNMEWEVKLNKDDVWIFIFALKRSMMSDETVKHAADWGVDHFCDNNREWPYFKELCSMVVRPDMIESFHEEFSELVNSELLEREANAWPL